MRRFFLFVVLMVSGGSNAFAFGDPTIGKVPGAMATMENLDGTPVDLSKYRGQVLILYFGADWCGPCVQEGRPAVLAALNKYRADGLKVLYANMDGNNVRAKKVEEAKALGIDIVMTSLSVCPAETCNAAPRTSTGRLGDFGKIYRIPTALIIDREGILRAKMEDSRYIAARLDSEVERILKAK